MAPGDRVEVREVGIPPWQGEVVSGPKPSGEMFYVEVRRDDRMVWAVPIKLIVVQERAR